jgi:TetR/AcrR family transcriptional regulator, cholesterol catabolism regulator
MSRGPNAKPKMPSPEPKVHIDEDVSPRKRRILEIAAQLFARKGYRGTSIRDIGEQAGVLGGSLYHHIKSKDALFVELHNAALDMAAGRIAEAVGRESDPWSRLEAACVALLEVQLDPDSLTLPLMNDFREVSEDVRGQLIARRDAFEDQFREIVGELPLPPEIDRSIYRNLLLSLLNNAAHWYRPGRLSPADIGRQIARVLRH